MAFRNYLPVIHFHPILLLFIVIAFLTGTFINLFIILAIVLFHELGHYTAAMYFKWRIRSIMLWVFGGVMDTDEHGSRPVIEELLVTIAGPVQHLFIYGLILFAGHWGIFSDSVLEMVLYYNTLILIFNLLPLWPLDGGKLLFLLLSACFPYRKAYNAAIVISLTACLVILILQFTIWPFVLSLFLLMLFLLKENYNDWKQRYYVFVRFLLKRYQGAYAFRKIHALVVSDQSLLIDVFTQFQRGKMHTIYIEYPDNKRRTIAEGDCLHSYFFDGHYQKTIGEVAHHYQ